MLKMAKRAAILDIRTENFGNSESLCRSMPRPSFGSIGHTVLEMSFEEFQNGAKAAMLAIGTR